MSNQARASRHASGILPSKQFFAPRKPITQSASIRRKSTSPIAPNSQNTTSPTPQTTSLSFTSTTGLPPHSIQSEEEEVSLLHQSAMLSSLSSVVTSANPSLDQSLDSIFSSELSESAPGRTAAPIRPPSALLIRRSYRQQTGNGDISQATIDSVLEPVTNVPVLESTTYRHSALQNTDSRDFAMAASFTRHSDNTLPNTPSTKLHLISPKNTSTKQTSNVTTYSVAAKHMPRIITKSSSISNANEKGHKRLYQVWPGRNRFFLGGRIMTSRDFPAFLIAFCALIIPSGLFLGFTCPYLYRNVSPAVVFIFIYFFLLALTSMLRTSWSDPGIIPRNLDPSPPTEDLEDTENNANSDSYPPTRSIPLPKEVKINGQTIRLKYCETCKIYRPPRCSHCRQCDNCVENEDHHCIWLNNCIGRRNYRTFFTFIATATVLCFYVLGFCLVHLFLVMKDKNNNFVYSIIDAPVSFGLAVLTFFLMWSVGGLTGYHMYLISKNLTTHEQIRVPLSRRNGTRNLNPFDFRSFHRNCLWVLCRPLTRSSVSRRSFVDENDLDECESAQNELQQRRTNNSVNTETTIIEQPKSKELTNLESPTTESRERQDQFNAIIV